MAVEEERTESEVRFVVSSDEPEVEMEVTAGTVKVGMKIDEFVIQSLLGRGGVSEVYRAHDTRTDTIVALKFLLPSRLTDKQSRARLRNEARHIMSLRHRSIVSVLDVRESDSAGPYLVMEFLDGKALTEYLPLPQQQALEVCIQVAEALSYAHGTGMIHRDIKPSNVIVLADGSIRLVDFGLAKVFAQENAEHIPLTRTSEVMGTPLYMSPEQCFGQEVNATSDTYQLGCLLFQCITGFPPFEGSTSFEAMYKHVSAQPDLRTVSPLLRDLLTRALDKNPASRFQTASEMGQCLRDAQQGRNTVRSRSASKGKARRFKYKIAGCAVLCIALSLFLAQWQMIHRPAPPQASLPSLVASPADQAKAQALYEEGVSHKAKGWTEKARESLTKAIELDKGTVGFRALSFLRARLPAHAQSTAAEQLNIQAFNMAYSGHENEAEKLWKECIERYPTFEWPYSNLAGQYMNQGRLKDAVRLLERAIVINPYYTNALSNMSAAQWHLGNRDLAIRFMKQAAESAPEEESYRATLKKMQDALPPSPP